MSSLNSPILAFSRKQAAAPRFSKCTGSEERGRQSDRLWRRNRGILHFGSGVFFELYLSRMCDRYYWLTSYSDSEQYLTKIGGWCVEFGCVNGNSAFAYSRWVGLITLFLLDPSVQSGSSFRFMYFFSLLNTNLLTYTMHFSNVTEYNSDQVSQQ